MPFFAQHIKAARLSLQKNDPTMKQIIKQVGPFTAKTRRDRLATLVRSIISQQISTAAARTINGRFADALTAKKERSTSKNNSKEGSVFHAGTIAKFSLEQLRELGVSAQKGSYVLDLATKVDRGELDLVSIHKLDDDAAIEALTRVKGIGRWTAQIFLMFSLGRMNIFPVDDLGIKNAIQMNYGFDESPTKEEMVQCAQKWQPYATIASWYLWQSLELD